MSVRHAVHAATGDRAAAALALLRRAALDYRPAALASSLGAEDLVLTDLALRHGLEIEIFAIDTGRLHGDTLALIGTLERHYGCRLRVWRPELRAVNDYVARHGRDAFYADAELRRLCCHLRKVEPLARALAGKRAWITGLRREQSPTRVAVEAEEYDAVHGLAKFNPLVDWGEREVWDYLHANAVPYNALYDQGYRSIGCAPCTRPVLPGEEARAGRWWWESPLGRECGLHVAADGRLVQAAAGEKREADPASAA